jgi:hypothetical protein
MKRTLLTTSLILVTAAIIGFDHLRFTYPISGVNQRLSNVTKPDSRVVKEILVS